MSPEDDPQGQVAPSEPHGEGPVQWLLALGLGAAAAITITLGLSGAPTTEELLERARTPDDPRTQVQAMHALILRGYWEERPLEELTSHLESSSAEVGDFVTRMHGSLLRPR